MTMELAPPEGASQDPGTEVRPDGEDHADDWRAELADYLRPGAFPARQDDLLALLIRKHAPSRLLWRVAQSAPGRTYRSLETLCEDAGRHGH